MRANLISTKKSASHRNSTRVRARPSQTESQVDPSFQLAFTCVYLRLRLARALNPDMDDQLQVHSLIDEGCCVTIIYLLTDRCFYPEKHFSSSFFFLQLSNSCFFFKLCLFCHDLITIFKEETTSVLSGFHASLPSWKCWFLLREAFL